MTNGASRAALLAAVLLIAIPRDGSAQSAHRGELSAGYSFMHASNEHLDFFAGWAAGAAERLNGWLSVAVDVCGHSKTLPAIDSDIHLRSLAAMAGARASAPIGAFSEFAQVLVGVVHTSGTLFGETDTATHLAVQPGLGIDRPLTGRLSARGELDVRFMATGHELRIVLGIVVR